MVQYRGPAAMPALIVLPGSNRSLSIDKTGYTWIMIFF